MFDRSKRPGAAGLALLLLAGGCGSDLPRACRTDPKGFECRAFKRTANADKHAAYKLQHMNDPAKPKKPKKPRSSIVSG